MKRELLFNPFQHLFDEMDNWTNLSDVHEPMDIYEDTEGLHIEVAVVGSKKDEIKVEVKDGESLTISKEGEVEKDEDRKYLIRRIRKGDFKTSLQIAPKFDVNQAKTKLENGLLSILIPIRPESKPKLLEINV